jgi:hypothetical protein
MLIIDGVEIDLTKPETLKGLKFGKIDQSKGGVQFSVGWDAEANAYKPVKEQPNDDV